MKKLSLLVFPLAAMSLLASCDNGGGDQPGEVKFSLSSDCPIKVLEDNKTAEVSVDWTPNDIIKFESFTFDATPTKDNTVTFDPTSYPRPMTVKITFKDDITEDISGTLNFTYQDVTVKTKGESSLSVTIPKPEPGNFKSLKKIEGTLTGGYEMPEGTTATFEYEYTSPTSFTITDTFHYPDSNTDSLMQKDYHNINTEENGLITNTYIHGYPSNTNGNDSDDAKLTLFAGGIDTYDEEGFVVKEQTLVIEDEYEYITEGKEVIDPVKVEASFEDAYDETFYAVEEIRYLWDENNNLTHRLEYYLLPNAQDKFEMQLYQINEYRYDANNRLVSNYAAYADDDEHYGKDITYDENGIVSTENTDNLTFKNTTTEDFFANYNPILTPLIDQQFNKTPYIRWSYAYQTAIPDDYSKYTLEMYSENLEEINPTNKYTLEVDNYCDVEIKEDGAKQETYYKFESGEYNYDTVEYRDMSSKITGPDRKVIYLEDKYGNRIKNCSYDYIGEEYVIDNDSHIEFNFKEGLLESLIDQAGDYGLFESTNIEYCDTAADYHQNPNWIFRNAIQINFV